MHAAYCEHEASFESDASVALAAGPHFGRGPCKLREVERMQSWWCRNRPVIIDIINEARAILFFAPLGFSCVRHSRFSA